MLAIDRADQARQFALDLEQDAQFRQAREEPQGPVEQFGVELIQVGGDLLAQVQFPRRRGGGDNMALPDGGAVPGLDPGLVPGPLGPQPQGQGGDLGGAGVDVHAVEVVLDDQAGDVAQKGRFVRISLAQGRECAFRFPFVPPRP